MTLTVNTVGDNPQQPGITAETYVPDQLIAGVYPRVTANITLGAGTLQRGTVLGQQSIGAGTATAGGGNTGNGTASAVTLAARAQIGNYVLTATAATIFQVVAPNGNRLADLHTGVAYTDEIGLTITAGGTAFVAGDTFTVAIAVGSGQYIQSVATATDGSQVPAVVLADYADASGGAVNTGAYLTGEFNANALIFDGSFSLAAITAALAIRNIYVKNAVSAADPS